MVWHTAHIASLGRCWLVLAVAVAKGRQGSGAVGGVGIQRFNEADDAERWKGCLRVVGEQVPCGRSVSSTGNNVPDRLAAFPRVTRFSGYAT